MKTDLEFTRTLLQQGLVLVFDCEDGMFRIKLRDHAIVIVDPDLLGAIEQFELYVRSTALATAMDATKGK